MVRLLGRISDKRIFFEDSKVIIDHGTTLCLGGVGYQDIGTHFSSVIFGWVNVRTAPSAAWVAATGGNAITIKHNVVALNATFDWFAIGYTT